MNKKRKRPLTLLEIMIVIFLIGLIGSVIGYNMKGSLDEGKAFKTEQAMSQIHEILLLEVAKGATVDEVVGAPEHFLKRSMITRDPDALMKDGWGQKIKVSAKGNDDFYVSSQALADYKAKKNKIKPVKNDQSSENAQD
jgi:type II secretory pathway pseudopilin PulG